MRTSLLCLVLLLLALGSPASARKTGHPVRSLAEEPKDPAPAAGSGTATAVATLAATGSADATTATPAGGAAPVLLHRTGGRGGASMAAPGCGSSGCGSSCGGGCGGGCGGDCGGGCPPPPPCGECGGGCPPPTTPCSTCGSSNWGKRKLQSIETTADEASKEVAALKRRVTELEQAQHDMAAVVAALQQQLGQIQVHLADAQA